MSSKNVVINWDNKNFSHGGYLVNTGSVDCGHFAFRVEMCLVEGTYFWTVYAQSQAGREVRVGRDLGTTYMGFAEASDAVMRCIENELEKADIYGRGRLSEIDAAAREREL